MAEILVGPESTSAPWVEVVRAPDPHVDLAEQERIDARFAELLELDRARTRPEPDDRSFPQGPGADRFYDPALNPGLRRWREKHVPTAAALVPIQRPGDRLVDGTPLNDFEQGVFRSSRDAVGVRSRGWILGQELLAGAAGHPSQRWLSLACGAALPVFDAALLARSRGIQVQLDLADHDGRALDLAGRLATELGLAPARHRLNVLDPRGVATRLGFAAFDAVDVLGLFEYLDVDDSVFRYEKVVSSRERRFAGAVTFLRNAYDLVRPGGLLVIGNMLDTHPQLDVLSRIVQWPMLKPRSPEQVRDIAVAAGLPPESMRVLRAEDGVYAVYVVRKPV